MAPGAPADELFPDLDTPLLIAALEGLGASSETVSWDDDRQRWSDFDAVVIRSTWDSVDRPEEYCAWARDVESHTILVNPAAAVEATMDKVFMRSLSDAGVRLPPTTFVMPGEAWEPPAGDFVVKPTVSAGGRETALYGLDEHFGARAHVARLHERGTGVMVQEHLPAVNGRGEIKHVFIGSVFSHAIRSGPLLRHGAGVLERPWEVPVGATPIEPTTEELTVASAALRLLEAELGLELTYARVDVVSRATEDVVLMEIEVIDPSLSLWASNTAADHLARALLHACQ